MPEALRIYCGVLQSNCGMAAVQQNIACKRELLAGDIIEVRSRVLEVREKVIRFLLEMTNAETSEWSPLVKLQVSTSIA